MTIDTTNYLNSLYQNTQTTQKTSTSEVGKTERSSVSASLDQVNMGEDGVAVTEVRRLQGAEQTSNQQKQSASPRMDTVEISAEGKAASARLQGQQTASGSSSSSVEDYLAEEEDDDDLSQYTDAQLKQMYLNGDITRQEYEDATGETI